MYFSSNDVYAKLANVGSTIFGVDANISNQVAKDGTPDVKNGKSMDRWEAIHRKLNDANSVAIEDLSSVFCQIGKAAEDR